jgi:hypothetical protein
MAERRERGQAQIELIAGVPLLILAALVSLQLLAVLYAQSLADGAAEAGAIAAADGRDEERAARDGLPGWARSRIDVQAEDGRVRVELEPPALVPWLADRLAVDSDAYARPEGG